MRREAFYNLCTKNDEEDHGDHENKKNLGHQRPVAGHGMVVLHTRRKKHNSISKAWAGNGGVKWLHLGRGEAQGKLSLLVSCPWFI